MSNNQPTAIYLKDYQVPPFTIKSVDLVFDLNQDNAEVTATLKIKRHPLSTDKTTTLILNGEQLDLLELKINQNSILEQTDLYKESKENLTLYQLPDSFELTTQVRIYPHLNTALEGLYRSAAMFCTQCEAEGFRKITYFLDRPDVMATFCCEIRADKTQYPILLSNGNPQKAGDLSNNRHFAIWQDPIPKPCYLFALVAGDLEKISAEYSTHPSNKKVTLNIYVEAENIKKCDYALTSLINAMRWDEQQYGREYDLDLYNIVAVNDFNMGAMENKGLNIFNSKYVLTSPETATDKEYQGVEGVIAHEYFHNWTGNRITCRDWFQLSLKEGLTVYRDQCFSADMGSKEVKRIEDVRMLRSHQFIEDAGAMAHPVRPASYIEINNFYTLTIYEKGAEVVRMQAQLLGAENYRKATDLYFQRHDGQAVTTDDFVQCMADISGQDFTQFKHWYDYAGTPLVNVTSHYNKETQEYSLTFIQNDNPAFLIPIAMGLLDNKGHSFLEKDLVLTEKESTFVFKDITTEPTPSLLRGFSAPINLIYPYSNQQLLTLMAFDSDGFNRWNAGQQLLQQQILAAVEALAKGEKINFDSTLVDAYQNAFKLSETNPALLAEMMSLPSESYLAEQMTLIDIENIHQAREALLIHLASQLKTTLLTIYRELNNATSFDVSATAIAKRRLKNICLAWLMRLQDPAIESFCLQQYQAQQNMTDVLSTLQLINNFSLTKRQVILDDFYQRWSSDPLVLDKWFSVQAQNQAPNCLDEIKKLLNNPHFSIKNPNKVRSLIGAFANSNPLNFHRADGSGYVFLGEQIQQLDEINPQISARLMRIFANWRKFDSARQEKIKSVLEKVLNNQKISKDLYEITKQCLK